METLLYAEAEERHPGSYIETEVVQAGGENQIHMRVWKDKAAYDAAQTGSVASDAVVAEYVMQKQCMYQNPDIPI